MRTIQKLAKEAIDVQDTCNMRGVSKGFARMVDELYAALEAAGTDCGTRAICKHPITQLWCSKLHDLANMGMSDSDAFSVAYEACKKLAGLEGRDGDPAK